MVFKSIGKWSQKTGKKIAKGMTKAAGINPVLNKRGMKNMRSVLGGVFWRNRRKK